jgi:hypothetical protein
MGPVNRRNLARGGIVLAAWLVATGSGPCAFFNPTAPESPNRPPVRADYSTPENTLASLARGMADKNQSNGQDVYMGALADSSAVDVLDGRAFHALFDTRDLLDHPWPYDWTREFEPQLLRDLYLKYASPFEMTWEPYEPGGNEEQNPNDALLHRKYTLVQLITNGNTVRRDPIAIGAADLYFVRSQRNPANWVIAIWQDVRTADADSAQITSLGKRRLETQPR